MKNNIVLCDVGSMNGKEEYLKQVVIGFNSSPKYLPFKYNYDEHGSELCSKILQSEEYYIWKSDKRLLEQRAKQIIQLIRTPQFNLIDLGAGDGLKTKILVKEALKQECKLSYYPIDIRFYKIIPGPSNNDIDRLVLRRAVLGEYKYKKPKNVYFFPGSTFGNEGEQENQFFIQQLWKLLKKGDILCVGVDLWKNPQIIARAYENNPYEKDFIMNGLHRINKQLNGNFNIEQFKATTFFDPYKKCVFGLVISTKEQSVKIGDHEFSLKQLQPINIFCSRKWLMQELVQIFENRGFSCLRTLTDSKNYFGYGIFQKEQC